MQRRSARVAASAAARAAAPVKSEPKAEVATQTGPAPRKARAPGSAAAPKRAGGPKKRAAAAAPKRAGGSKRRAAAAAPKAPVPSAKRKKTGLKGGLAADAPLGVVDPASKLEGDIYCTAEGEPLDAMLVLVDPPKNMDKFFCLQVIELDTATAEGQFVLYTRWGRTGAAGQALEQVFHDANDALQCFEMKFKDKAGKVWEDRADPAAPPGKYSFLSQNFAAKRTAYQNVVWEYWVDDGTDGKADGWYPYDAPGAAMTEQLYHEAQANPAFTTRIVDSGTWTYRVDLRTMAQTNVTHPSHTVRRIRRVAPGTRGSSDPPTAGTAAAAAPPAAKSSRPVDVDISVVGRKASDFEVAQSPDESGAVVWHDVVLNQCDITGSSNNNKYYRLQALQCTATGKYYTWTRWGRVGEPSRKSTSALFGPFPDLDGALSPFAKKYKDKTGNVWGDAAGFKPRRGKYEPIEIDNDVSVPDGDAGAAPAAADVQYLPSPLYRETKELVEAMFSKDVRNSALATFNLDLRRLPLGVPSQQQIQHGVAVLNKIKDKLAGGRVAETFPELSSAFYTAIPHSFGRSRPPPIDTADVLQSRYDMADMLSDMYTQNETVRRIETAQPKKRVVPSPVDLQYQSLKADLELVDFESDEWVVIAEYFAETKGAHSSAELLNAWEVNREGEAERHEAFSSIKDRRLLFHGTSMAVAGPIVTSGLRIMPHSGGRVGAGIYLASQMEKSAQYTSGNGAKFAVMFLVEAALGKSHRVTSDGPHASSLRAAPSGFDSVHAVGEVSPGVWRPMEIDGHAVSVPQGSVAPSGVDSTFEHDEFLVYSEAQVRLRYVLTVKLP
jgi:poly [ADP-ribose] polymerase 2/3/4